MRIWLFLNLFLSIFCHIQGDTKILREVNILGDDAFRKETFSLKNENSDAEELVIEGSHTQTLRSKDISNYFHRIETIYIADKNGNRVKYIIVREPALAAGIPPSLALNPSSLKALGG